MFFHLFTGFNDENNSGGMDQYVDSFKSLEEAQESIKGKLEYDWCNIGIFENEKLVKVSEWDRFDKKWSDR